MQEASDNRLDPNGVRKRLFAISGVSGGAMGAVMVTASLNAKVDSNDHLCVVAPFELWYGKKINNWRGRRLREMLGNAGRCGPARAAGCHVAQLHSERAAALVSGHTLACGPRRGSGIWNMSLGAGPLTLKSLPDFFGDAENVGPL